MRLHHVFIIHSILDPPRINLLTFMKKSQKTNVSPIKEDTHFFLFDKNSPMPIIIENIGITYPSPNYKMRRKLSNYFIFEYIVSGKGYLEVEGKKHTVEEGDVYILQPGQPHSYYADAKTPFKKIWINFFSDFFVEVFRKFGLYKINYFPNANCLSLFEELLSLSKLSNYSDEVCHQVCSVIFQIICILSAQQQNNFSNPSTAQKIKQILDAHLFSSITIDELTQKLFLSKAQLISIFRKKYNTSPHQYFLDTKIKMAKRLLISSQFSIQEISEKLSFVDPHYFSRLFKNKVGVSPTQYRTNKRISSV